VASTSSDEHSGTAMPMLLTGLFAMGVGALILPPAPRVIPPCDCSARSPLPSPPSPDASARSSPLPFFSAPPAASTPPCPPGTVPWFEVDEPGTSL
jgi:hypothetical protein